MQGLLLKSLPQPFVRNFIKDHARGFLQSVRVNRIQEELLKSGTISLTGKEIDTLQWATTLHDITYIEDRAEYLKVFAGNDVSKESIFPVLTGLNIDSVAKFLREAGQFNLALQKRDAPLYPFHHITAALFAYNILRDELGSDAVIAAQAILFHHERNLDLIPANTAVRLLRDAVKIKSLSEWDLNENIKTNVNECSRSFFDPFIPMKLRKEILEGRVSPAEQESRDPGLTLDAFQFAMEFLFPDTNPDMFALPGMVKPYLERDPLFFKFLNVILISVEKYEENTIPQIENLRLLKVLLRLALKNGKYSGSVDYIKAGEAAVKGNLDYILLGIENSIKSYPSKEFPSLAALLSLKAMALNALERNKERNAIMAEALLRHRIESVMNGDLEGGSQLLDEGV